MRTSIVWLDGWRKDLRYAARSLAAQPTFTAMALLALVVGIAINVALFTAVNAIWTYPWNVPEPERVVEAYATNPAERAGYWGFPLATARFLNDNSLTIEGAVASRSDGARVTTAGVDDATTAAYVTANFFDVLHVGIQTGRAFRADEDDHRAPSAVAVISDWLWRQRYGADSGAVGATITVEGVPFTVIGVAAQDFTGTSEDRVDVWMPFASVSLVEPTSASLFEDPTHCCSSLAARLRPGVAPAEAAAEWNSLHAAYMRDLGLTAPEIVLTGTAMLDHPQRGAQAAVPIAIVSVAFGAVLLLACANVTNLLLARGAARQAEIAVRLAIGAARRRIVRQLLTEAAVLAAAAAAIALPLSYVLPAAALRLMGQNVPTGMSLAPDSNVLLYALAVAALCTFAFGLAPALQATRTDMIGAIKRSGGTTARRSALRSVALGIQVAVSTALLVAAALLVRGVDYARTLDFGFRTDGVSAVAVTLPPNAYDAAAETTLYNTVIGRLGADQPVALSFLMPLGERHEFTGATCAGRRFVRTHMVSPKYFDVLQIATVEGRTFATANGARAVVVNEAFARLCSPGRPLAGRVENIGNLDYEILGVVRDAQLHGTGGVDPIVFMPFAPGPVFRGEAVFLLPAALADRAAAGVRELEPRATAEIVPMREQVERWLGNSTGFARAAGTIGGVALLLAVVGVYGVFSYYVEQRRREIGVRIALGARAGQIVRLVVRQNAPALVGGLAVGLAIAAAESLVLRSELHGLSAADALAYLAVLFTMLAAGTAASALPARRATLTEPSRVLHYE